MWPQTKRLPIATTRTVNSLNAGKGWHNAVEVVQLRTGSLAQVIHTVKFWMLVAQGLTLLFRQALIFAPLIA